MAVFQRMASDLSGMEGDPSEFGAFVLRSGPGIDRALAFDVLPSEVEGLTPAPDTYVCEIRRPGEVSGETIVCTLKELTTKIVPKDKTFEDLMESARSLRGRRPGSTVRGNGT